MQLKSVEKRVAAQLLAAGDLEEPILERVLAEYDGSIALHDLLVAKGAVTPKAACRALAEVNGMNFIELKDFVSEADAREKLTPSQAWKLKALPLTLIKGVLTVAVSDPSDVFSIDELKIKTKCTVVTLIAEESDLRDGLERYYGLQQDNDSQWRESTEANVAIPNPSASNDSYQFDSSLSGFHDTKTRTDIDLTDLESHAEYQRRVRQMRQSGDAIPVEEQSTQFEETSGEGLARIESERERRGAYEEPPDALQTQIDEAPPPAVSHLNKLLNIAAEKRAEELELAPFHDNMRVRLRMRGLWEPATPYELQWHEDVINRLKVMAGLEEQDNSTALEHRFLLPTKRGEFLCYLFLQPTEMGPRALIRFLDTVPLLGEPLLNIGLKKEIALRVNSRLSVRGGGLLFVTAPDARMLNSLYASLMRALSHGGSRDALSLERPPMRRLPSVTSISCPTEEVLLASLANSSYMNPDVIGVSSVESGLSLNRLVDAGMRGSSVVGCYTAPSSDIGALCFKAARIDPMNYIRGVIGHLHVQEISKLCPQCRSPVPYGATLPDWAEKEPGEFMQRGEGCQFCRGTGFYGVEWLAEFFEPDLMAADGRFIERTDRSQMLLNLALSGEIDPRTYAL